MMHDESIIVREEDGCSKEYYYYLVRASAFSGQPLTVEDQMQHGLEHLI
jgi:hypothetical protein